MFFNSFYRSLKRNAPFINLFISSSSLTLQLRTIYKTKTEKKELLIET
uniref:Uncharacterized protein n=1 Tax=viral metagenome TaxID=1070528 RepID=A0A6C0K0X7_9ZZZZ